jgi:hypothetical protein
MCELDSSWSEIEPVRNSCENGNEPTSSIKGRGYSEYLSDYLLLMKDCSRELAEDAVEGRFLISTIHHSQ